MGHRALSVLRVSTSALGMETWAVAEWGLLSAQHWGKGCTGKYQVKDLGVPWPRLC